MIDPAFIGTKLVLQSDKFFFMTKSQINAD